VHNARNLDGRSLWRLTQHEQDREDVVTAISQSKAALGPWVAQLRNWDLYATFTYDPQRFTWWSQPDLGDVPPPSSDASRRHMLAYLECLSDELGREIGAFCALETTKRGWPHWHGLIAAGGLDKSEFRSALHLWFDRRGYAKFSRVDRGDHAAVAAYCSKYLCKEDGDVLLWGKLAGSAPPGQLKLRRPDAQRGEV
jgi:hypothetical protein